MNKIGQWGPGCPPVVFYLEKVVVAFPKGSFYFGFGFGCSLLPVGH